VPDGSTTGFKGLVRGTKDLALAYTARSLLNRRFRAFGEVTDLALDTAHHSVSLRVALRGEPEPIDVHVSRYAIDRTPSGPVLTVMDGTASREWLTAVLREFAVGRPWPIPSNAGVLPRLLT
jgi:hypothetical protein